MANKLALYDRHGIDAYSVYNLERNQLDSWLCGVTSLDKVPYLNGWSSPRLGIFMALTNETLATSHLDGRSFLSSIKWAQRFGESPRQTEQERQRAEQLAAKLRDLGIDPETLSR